MYLNEIMKMKVIFLWISDMIIDETKSKMPIVKPSLLEIDIRLVLFYVFCNYCVIVSLNSWGYYCLGDDVLIYSSDISDFVSFFSPWFSFLFESVWSDIFFKRKSINNPNPQAKAF